MRFVTTNPGKVHSLGSLLAPYGIPVEHLDHELTEPQTHDLSRIARVKVEQAYDRFGPQVLVQDSGYELDAWPGFPGSYVKMINETIGNAGILALVAGRARGASFRTVWAYHDGSSVVTYDEFERGMVAHEERGTLDATCLSPLWRIHIPEHATNPGGKTLAQMSPEEHDRRRGGTSRAPFVAWIVGLGGQ